MLYDLFYCLRSIKSEDKLETILNIRLNYEYRPKSPQNTKQHIGTTTIIFFIISYLLFRPTLFTTFNRFPGYFSRRHGNLGEAIGIGAEAAAESRERSSGGIRAADSWHQRGQSETATARSKAEALEQSNVTERGAS